MKSVIAKVFVISLLSFPAWGGYDKPLSEAIATTDLVSAGSPVSTVLIDGKEVGVEITAWSDTLSGSNRYVESANLGTYAGSLTVTNSAGKGDDHYIDNIAYYDMVLFSFDQAVTLTGASFLPYYNANGKNDVTVAGLNDSVSRLFESGVNTWSDIAGEAIANASGHFGIKNNQSTFEGLASAKYWLVGAYNSVFSDENNQKNSVKFKLSSLGIELAGEQTTPPTQVSEPGALALMSLGLGLVLYRRKRRV